VHVTIRNQAKHLLICTLNSGRTIHLEPDEASEPVDHLEINGNQKIEALARAGLVSVATKDFEDKITTPTARSQSRLEK
jgi:hypothetical protein